MQAGQTIAVTGGAGFVGSELCRQLLTQGHCPRVIDLVAPTLQGLAAAPVDLLDTQELATALTVSPGSLPAAVVHLAAAHRDDLQPTDIYHRVNVQGTCSLCAAAERVGMERIILASSVAVYGDAPPGTGESGVIAPVTPYGHSKAGAEAVLRDWQARDPDRRSLVIVRPALVIGPGHTGNLRLLIDSIRRRRFVMVGNGTNRKAMCLVDNLALFLIRMLDMPPGVHVFNYVDGPDLDMNELIGLIRRHWGLAGQGPRLPLWAVLALVPAARMAGWATAHRPAFTVERLRKFMATTTFTSAAHSVPGFRAGQDLRRGLEAMLIGSAGPVAGARTVHPAGHRHRITGAP